MCWAGDDACRGNQVGAAVALQCLMHVLMALNGADRAHHDAGPASDAFFQVDDYFTSLVIFANAAGDASQSASRLFAVTALDCNRANALKRSSLIDRFNMNSRAARRMRRGAGKLARSARQAFFYQAKNPLHIFIWIAAACCRFEGASKLAHSKDQGMRRVVLQRHCPKKSTTDLFRFHSFRPIPDSQEGSQCNRRRYRSSAQGLRRRIHLSANG